ncbi:MAG: SprT-like domain-containing protein [Paludibacteraceae bacterium]|nr:SprT-like domain-containing protein [Paludibacteraceae bacterium]
MIATVAYIEKNFEEFNKLLFGGELPKIPILLGRATRVIGSFTYRVHKTFWGKKVYSDLKLRFSTKFDLPENELQDVIIHEMIHYYIHFKNLKDKSAHGPLFKDIMNQINKNFGRNISIRHKGAVRAHEQMADAKPRYRVVAVVTMKDGKTGIKVLPRIKEKVHHYYKAVSAAPTVSHIALYITQNPFFGQYPCSSALRIHYVDHSILQPQLAEATMLPIKDILQ